MQEGVAMTILFHGTTQHRAKLIEEQGPDPNFVEPNGVGRAESFSACLVFGPFPLGTPEAYACLKAKGFPSEGGPAMLGVDVPDDIITLAVDEKYFPLGQGFVQFDEDAGLEELRAIWPDLRRRVISLECP